MQPEIPSFAWVLLAAAVVSGLGVFVSLSTAIRRLGVPMFPRGASLSEQRQAPMWKMWAGQAELERLGIAGPIWGVRAFLAVEAVMIAAFALTLIRAGF